MAKIHNRAADLEYAKLLADEGSRTPCDADINFEMIVPEWADHNKIKRAQLFFVLNFNAVIRGIWLGLLQIIPEQTIFQILNFTRQSATPRTAYRRYRATQLHGMLWEQNEVKPGSKAWRSLEQVRKIHVMISKRAEKAGLGIISQKDMAITQYAFVGSQLLNPEKLGIVATREDLENFAHSWRVRGAMLGIEDRFNICGSNLDETLRRVEAVRQEFIVPALDNMTPEVENYLRIAVEGFKGIEPWQDVDTQIFTCKKFAGANTDSYPLSFYTRLRIKLDEIFFEYLLKVFVFRMCFTVLRLMFSVFDKFPIFAILKFGRKYAYVEVMKGKLKEK